MNITVPSSTKTKVLVSNEFYDLHRGEKDFFLARYLASKRQFTVYLLHSRYRSLLDSHESYHKRQQLYSEYTDGYNIKTVCYQAIRLIRNSGAKRTAFLLPNIFSYLHHLISINPDAIIDVIYTTLTPRSILNGLFARLRKKTLVLIDPGDEGKNNKLIPGEQMIFNYAQRIITTSKAAKEKITRKYSLLDQSKIIISHKMISTSTFRFDPSCCSSMCTIGYVGRFLKAKGFGKFLEISESLPQNVRCIAVGKNEDNYPINRKVEFFEMTENKNLPKIYSSIDILIIPDLSAFQSYPTVAQEALLCGCEVWVGNISEEYFPSSSYFHFIKDGDMNEFNLSLSYMQTLSFKQKREMRKFSSAHYRYELSPQRVAEQIEILIHSFKAAVK